MGNQSLYDQQRKQYFDHLFAVEGDGSNTNAGDKGKGDKSKQPQKEFKSEEGKPENFKGKAETGGGTDDPDRDISAQPQVPADESVSGFGIVTATQRRRAKRNT